MGFIDADAHVDECAATWDFVAPSDWMYKPVYLEPPEGGYRTGDTRPHPLWLIGGNVRLKRYRDDQLTGTTEALRELKDVQGRLRHLDELGIDVQIIYPTAFIHAVTTQPEEELAIHGAYNRWLADRTADTNGRLRWAYVPPILSMDKAVAELEWAKENGACAVMKKGVEYDRPPHDPSFFPLYAEAERLDLPICFHQGTGSLMPNAGPTVGASMARLTILAAFSSLAENHIPQKFPGLRWGFIEAGASWIPYLLKELGMRGNRDKVSFDFDTEFLRENHFYVTCDTEDNIRTLVTNYGAEDYLMIGTDYSHQDPSAELRANDVIMEMEGLSATVATKITSENARRLYGL